MANSSKLKQIPKLSPVIRLKERPRIMILTVIQLAKLTLIMKLRPLIKQMMIRQTMTLRHLIQPPKKPQITTLRPLILRMRRTQARKLATAVIKTLMRPPILQLKILNQAVKRKQIPNPMSLNQLKNRRLRRQKTQQTIPILRILSFLRIYQRWRLAVESLYVILSVLFWEVSSASS
jgi:hypothetical protein